MSKRMWLLTLALSLLAVLAAVAWRCWPRTVPLSQCSEVYQRYHDTPGIQASFIKNKQINDTLCLDMTLFEADDSASFAALLRAMGNREEFIRDMATLRDMFKDKEDANRASFTGDCLRGQPGVQGTDDPTENEVVSYFPVMMWVAVFHTHTEEEFMAVLRKGYFGRIDMKQ